MDDRCPRCQTTNWNVDIVNIPASSEVSRPFGMPSPPLGANYVYTNQPTGFVSMLSVVCTNCGYTMFHNMGILGV